jgi:hypothetical protein
MMGFLCRRLDSDGLSIISRWFDPAGKPLCWCLEPGAQTVGHPCIPARHYSLRLRTVGQKHRDYQAYYDKRFEPGWHRGMVEIVVPGRTAIEFHVGNTVADTLGCSLAGSSAVPPDHAASGHWEVARSRAAYEAVYPILRDAVLAGAATLTITEVFGGKATA